MYVEVIVSMTDNVWGVLKGTYQSQRDESGQVIGYSNNALSDPMRERYRHHHSGGLAFGKLIDGRRLASIHIKDDPAGTASQVIDAGLSIFEGDIEVLGAWNADGTQFGTEPEGVASPVYQLRRDELEKWLTPSTNGSLPQVHLRAGRSPRDGF